MCQFKSAIVTANGDVLHSPWTDSHEDLVRIFKLNDKANVRGEPRFARIEYRPEAVTDLDKPEKYTLKIDERRTPEWFTEGMQKRVLAKMDSLIKAMIISGDADLLIGGEFILTKGARVASVKTCRILAMLGDASIKDVRDSASITGVRGSASITGVRDSASITDVGGSASIKGVRDSASITGVRDSASITDDKRIKNP